MGTNIYIYILFNPPCIWYLPEIPIHTDPWPFSQGTYVEGGASCPFFFRLPSNSSFLKSHFWRMWDKKFLPLCRHPPSLIPSCAPAPTHKFGHPPPPRYRYIYTYNTISHIIPHMPAARGLARGGVEMIFSKHFFGRGVVIILFLRNVRMENEFSGGNLTAPFPLISGQLRFFGLRT